MKPAKGLISWIKSGINEVASAIDAEREARIAQYAARIEAEIQRAKQAFVFQPVADQLSISRGDLPVVIERVYQRFLARSWSDMGLTSRESELLAWLAQCLGLPPDRRSALDREAAASVFRQVLASALADNRITDEELTHLTGIATAIGHTVPSMMAAFFQRDGEAMVRASFTQYVADGRLEEDEWRRFQETIWRLGVPQDAVLQAIRLPAKQLVEHSLADARSDGDLSDEEQHLIEWLLANLIDDAAFATYVRTQVSDARFRSDISKGRLPSIEAPPDAALRAGEIAHYSGPVRYVRTRELASGPRVDELSGQAVITDSRFILTAPMQSFQISHRKILGHRAAQNGLEIQTDGKGTGWYEFPADHDRAVPIWRVAVGRANQTIVDSSATNSRHIPRDIRQRVWQRYGGRCAECGATEYLEFDHIVPVAKGGSNSESNVQLLCRKCNLSKSDRI